MDVELSPQLHRLEVDLSLLRRAAGGIFRISTAPSVSAITLRPPISGRSPDIRRWAGSSARSPADASAVISVSSNRRDRGVFLWRRVAWVSVGGASSWGRSRRACCRSPDWTSPTRAWSGLWIASPLPMRLLRG